MLTKFLREFNQSYVQTFCDTGGKKELVRVFPMSQLDTSTEALNKAGAGVFFTPNPCKDGRKEENVTSIDWVYVDMDNGTKDDMRVKIKASPIRPDLIIESKRSYHIYWKVSMMDKKDFHAITQGLIKHFDGDPAISSINEVLRFPSFFHMKDPKDPYEVKIKYFNIHDYSSMQMRDAFPYVEEKKVIKHSTGKFDDVKDIPITEVLHSLGVPIKNGFILDNGEVTSASVNEKENYINRFSGKEGSGSTIDACMAYGKMTLPNAINYLKKMWHIKDIERIVEEKPTKDKIDEVNENPFTWGTEELDKKITPIEKNHYNIIAGETSAGKTCYAFDMAVKNVKLGHKILYLTLEMSTDGVYTRIARDYAGIDKEKWRNKKLISEGQIMQYKRKKKELLDLKGLTLIGMTDSPSLDRIHEVIKKVDPDLVFIDNFDKIEKNKALSEVGAQTEISAKILAICEDTPIPIIVIHHLKKGEDSDLNKPRNINSLRGSGKIGHDAYTVVMAYRSPFKEEQTIEEKAKFTIIEIKDREFGTGGYHVCYFNKGTFSDKPPLSDTIALAEKMFMST